MVAPITLSEVLSIVNDVADASRYLLLLGSIPGSGESSSLSIKCFQAELPGIGNQAYDATMSGHTVNFRGRVVFTQTMSCAFYVDGNGDTLRRLQQWHENVAGTESGNSQGYVDDYAVDATLISFDTTGKEYNRYTVYRVYPDNVPPSNVDGGNSQAAMIQVSFKYCYHESTVRQLL